MNTVACFKYVPDMDSIKINSDRSLELKSALWEISQYDLRAVEEAVKLATESGGTAVALTVGGEILSNSKMRKAILSRGPAQLYGIQDETLENADSNLTAKALKAAIEKIGDIDLVICGEGSSDQYNQQVGNIIGGLLGWITVNAVSKIERADQKLILERSLEDGVEVIEVSTPAVLSVTADINIPRIPSMKDILAAGKKPVSIYTKEDVLCSSENVSIVKSVLAPKQNERLQHIIENADNEGIAKFAATIRHTL